MVSFFSQSPPISFSTQNKQTFQVTLVFTSTNMAKPTIDLDEKPKYCIHMYLCLSAICALTCASTLVGSWTASLPSTRIRLLMRTCMLTKSERKNGQIARVIVLCLALGENQVAISITSYIAFMSTYSRNISFQVIKLEESRVCLLLVD